MKLIRSWDGSAQRIRCPRRYNRSCVDKATQELATLISQALRRMMVIETGCFKAQKQFLETGRP